jgi:hypothetical protein
MEEPINASIPSPKPASDKFFKVSLIIIGLLIVIGLFLNAYLLLKKEKAVNIFSPTPTPISILPTSIPTSSETVYAEDTRSANWKTYKNEKYGVIFRYPPNWKFNESTYKKEFAPYEECLTEVILDPEKINESETLDIPGGSISVRMSTESNHTIGYQSMKDVKIGVDSKLSGKISEETTGKNSPNPVYLDTHEIVYYLSNEGKGYITISYISGLNYGHVYISNTNDEYLNSFNQILSTFRFD